MDTNSIIQLIQSIGFPIVMCGVLAWFIYDLCKRHAEEISRLNEQHASEISRLNDLHSKEMDSVVSAVHNNTIALERLCTLMEVKSDEDQ